MFSDPDLVARLQARVEAAERRAEDSEKLLRARMAQIESLQAEVSFLQGRRPGRTARYRTLAELRT